MTEQGGRSGVLIGPCTAQINRILNVNICFVSNICWVYWVHLEDATRKFFYPVRTSTLVCLCVLKLLSEERLLIFPSHSWTNTPHRPKMKFINPMTWHLAVRKTFPHILNYYQTHSHSHIHIHSSMQGPATRQTTISQTLEILHINMLQSALKWVKVFFLMQHANAEWHKLLSSTTKTKCNPKIVCWQSAVILYIWILFNYILTFKCLGSVRCFFFFKKLMLFFTMQGCIY